MSSSRKWIAHTAVAVLVAGALTPGEAVGAQVADDGLVGAEVIANLPNEPAFVIGGELTSAQLQDLSTIAEERGWSLEEAIANSGWHESFAMLANALQVQFPNEYAGARIEPSGNPWIGFKGDVPGAAVDAVSAFETRVFAVDSPGGSAWSTHRVELVPNRGYSEAELVQTLMAAHLAVFSHEDLVEHVSSGYDIVTGVISVEVQTVDSLRAASAESIVAELVGRVPTLEAVTIRVVDDLNDRDHANLFGGVLMSGSQNCTSGFTTIRGSLRGIATAGHCPNAQSMSGVSLTFMQQHQGTYGDMQWLTAATHQDDFYSGSPTVTQTNLRDVSGTGNPVVGQELCKNGITTHKTCDWVFQLNQCDDSLCGLVAMEHREAADGDSGGPWFWGNTAYGLHQGEETIGGIDRDEFSKVTNIPNAFLSVYILVNG